MGGQHFFSVLEEAGRPAPLRAEMRGTHQQRSAWRNWGLGSSARPSFKVGKRLWPGCEEGILSFGVLGTRGRGTGGMEDSVAPTPPRRGGEPVSPMETVCTCRTNPGSWDWPGAYLAAKVLGSPTGVTAEGQGAQGLVRQALGMCPPPPAPWARWRQQELWGCGEEWPSHWLWLPGTGCDPVGHPSRLGDKGW